MASNKVELTNVDVKKIVKKMQVEFLVDTSKAIESINRIESIIQELEDFGVIVHDIAEAKFPDKSDLPLLAKWKHSLLLVNADGTPISGQRDMTINASLDSMVNADVNILVGGIYNG